MPRVETPPEVAAPAPRPDARPSRAPGRTWRPERTLALGVLVLVCFGLVMVYSASSATALLDDGDPAALAVRQVVFAALGLGAFVLFSRLHPRHLRAAAGLALVGAGVLLLAVLVPGVGTVANGSRRWIVLGPVQVQPSELAKLALVLWLAVFLARAPRRLERTQRIGPPLIVTGLLAALVLLEPDLGSAVLLVAVALAMLVVAGVPGRTLALVGAAVAALAALAIAVEPYRRERLLAFLDPWADPGGSGFQIVQAELALGSGGVSGVGLGDGLQKVFYLPEAHTDMIVATVGEELGLLGVIGLVAVIGVVVVSGFRIALAARDLHQQLLAAGISTLIAVQAAVNLGAVLGLLPVTGVPLPFVSYGGSSLVVFCASAGILVQIGRRSRPAGLRVVAGGAEDRHRGRRHGGARHAGARAG